ncbi:hypothetical protein D9619_013233 [Psilocybe cf. subviscida]|uniref:Uncharacterized protein n=1 Tax=Psilocybe cf. subviscida TaxID=2480587 RepID=A0A8H5BSL0_9AGAR|nr:hypothetical protein D9619_013233 [Psilocybe cf. subviscida]
MTHVTSNYVKRRNLKADLNYPPDQLLRRHYPNVLPLQSPSRVFFIDMAAGARATRSSAKTKTPTKTRAGALKNGSSPYFQTKNKADEEDSDALDDDDEEDDEDVDDAPKKRRGTVTRKETARKKRKLSEGEEEEDNDSDALDDDSEGDEDEGGKGRKRGKRSPAKKTPASPQKKRRKAKVDDDEEFDVDEQDLKEGQEVVGVVVQAPKTGHVPPGQISQNTLNFLTKLKDPACNDRDWFKLHEPVYRLAEKEWKDFVDAFTDVLVEVDAQVPHLPPKDVIHRIYRDVRFSNDKTPYKKGLSASFSRSGRKGIFAGCEPYVSTRLSPLDECAFLSVASSGTLQSSQTRQREHHRRRELVSRAERARYHQVNIQRNPRRLRQVLANPDFVKFFGEPKPHPKGERRSIFGMEDELKVAPKGVSKDDKDIDLLKCRSFAVVHKFTDSEVLSPDFKEIIGSVARVMQPLVHCLNDMMTIAGSGDDDEEEANDEEDEEDEDGDEGDEDPED